MNQFNGAWICPSSSIHWTNNIQFHSKVIEELGIREYLQKISSKLKWTKDELKNRYNLDIAYIAMKIGYIRITSIADQIGIQYGNDSIFYNEDVISSIENVLNKIHSKIFIDTGFIKNTIYLEKFESYEDEPNRFESIYDFIQYLKSKYIKN